jgi:hypothetical protein
MTQHFAIFPDEQPSIDTEKLPECGIGATEGSEAKISPALEKDLEDTAQRVRKCLENMSGNIIEVGHELLAVKRRLEHGQFLNWVAAKCGLSPRHAQLMIRAAEWAEDKCEIVSHLEPTAIYLLAAPSTPEMVRREVLSRLEQGHRPASHVVKQLIRAAKEGRPSKGENDRKPGALTPPGVARTAELPNFAEPLGVASKDAEQEAMSHGGAQAEVDKAEAQDYVRRGCKQDESRPSVVSMFGAPQIHPDLDPLQDQDPPWIDGALQLIPLLVDSLLFADEPSNRRAIILGALQFIPPLVEAVLGQQEIPKRGQIEGLLRYCGYKHYAESLAHQCR